MGWTVPNACERRPKAKQRGSAAVIFVLLLSFALAATTFAVDFGHLLLVRNELQNAADAAALAGAGALHVGATDAAKPNWAESEVRSAAVVNLNRSDGVQLADSTVETGFWDVTGARPGIQSKDLGPGPNDVPAVKVTVSRDTGKNGGPVTVWFGSFVGISEKAIGASAVAMVSGPGGVGAGSLFPVAITKCLYEKYWDSAKMRPKLEAGTGKPYVFKIGSDYHYDACSSGQWTSFAVDSNNVPTIRNLIEFGNPAPIGIGDNTWIQPGTKNTLYDEVPINTDVLIPVVVNLDNHAFVPVVALAAFHINKGVGGSGKYIEGYFTTNYRVQAGARGIGPYYGAFIPPRLAQ